MTDPQALAQRATARPWEQSDAGWIGTHAGWLAFAYRVENAAFIVYAVNHIEQAEAERDEALRLIKDAMAFGARRYQWPKRAAAFVERLRRHDAQPGGGG